MNRDDCNRWLRRQVEEKIPRLVLSTSGVNESKRPAEELLSVKVPRRPDSKWISSLSRRFEDAVRRDMESLSQGSQAYSIIAYGKDDEVMDRFTFREIQDGESGATPEPSTTGLLSQLMHHNRDLARVAADMHKASTSYYERTLGQLTDAVSTMIKEKLDTVALVENLSSQKHERDMAAHREEYSDAMKARLFQSLMSLGPVVVSKLTGKVLPGAPSENDLLVKSLVESIKPEQLEGLFKVLSPDQLLTVMSLIERFQKKEDEPRSEPVDSKNGSQPAQSP